MPTSTMLVGIWFGMPRQSRQLKAIAGEIETEVNAQHGTVKASIHYFRLGKVDGLAKLKEFQTEWKTALNHYARYPYGAGWKMLPAALVEEFVAVNKSYADRQDTVFFNWKNNEYQELFTSAPARMGSLYDPADFPTESDCSKRFRCDVTVMPLAEAEQWQRITVISPDLAATMANQQERETNRVIQQAHAKLWADVIKPIQNIVDQLSKDKGKIYDSLIGNVISITDLIPAYNEIHKDSNLTALAQQVKAKLAEIKPDDIRKSSEAKADALAKAQGIIKEFEPYARKFDLDDE